MKRIAVLFSAMLVCGCVASGDMAPRDPDIDIGMLQATECMAHILTAASPDAQDIYIIKVGTENGDRVRFEYAYYARLGLVRRTASLLLTTYKNADDYFVYTGDPGDGGPMTAETQKLVADMCRIKGAAP